MKKLSDFEWYSANCLKIQSKNSGMIPFKLRKIQKRYLEHLKKDFQDGIIRSISLKPRQAGWSTFIAGFNTHRVCTQRSYNGIVMADKYARTNAVHSIYTRYIHNLPKLIKPMIHKLNESEVSFDNPNIEDRKFNPGLSSGFITETAQDPNAGKSSSRQWAHLSEYAFYPYATELDTSVQNSISLFKGTAIFKESTANGMSGHGEDFYLQWLAAEAGESIYKPFFVAWFEVDDYALNVPRGFILTKEESDLILRCPQITNANLMWRRLKLKEYSSKDSTLTAEEHFKQDFPSYPEEAFLNSGRPVFNQDQLKKHIHFLRDNRPPILKVVFRQPVLSMYPELLTVFKAPEKGKKYLIGADVAEGVSEGDYSHAYIMTTEHVQVGFFHGHIDPDHFGKILVELARIYNDALLVPEINNMGHTTLTAIKSQGYLKVFMRTVYDEIALETLDKMGWRTTSANKQQMISKLASLYRDGGIKILDEKLLKEMMLLTREDDGDVSLTGKDRVVACCLACMGITQIYEKTKVLDPNKQEKIYFEQKDLFREKILPKEKKTGVD